MVAQIFNVESLCLYCQSTVGYIVKGGLCVCGLGVVFPLFATPVTYCDNYYCALLGKAVG